MQACVTLIRWSKLVNEAASRYSWVFVSGTFPPPAAPILGYGG